MNGFLRRQRARSRRRARAWRQDHPRLHWLLTAGGCLRWERESVARGVAAGPFYRIYAHRGIQTLLDVDRLPDAAEAIFPECLALSWVSNPFTMLPLYWLFNWIGEFIFGFLLKPDLFFAPILNNAMREMLLGLLGSLLIATPVAALGYTLTLQIWTRMERKLQARRVQRQRPVAEDARTSD
ncbi:MAG: DUF2062 domain-containing protein [Gammaproteobacteria bacterium]|nr:DUF2062 domain-containing protein [Gammaproteobacteria bacterium]